VLDTRTVVVQHQVVTEDPPTVPGVANSSEIAAGDPRELATPPDVVALVELRRALTASQFCYFQKNLADTTECLYKWHVEDRDTLRTSTMDLVKRLRGTSAGAAMSQENLAAIVVSAKRFSHRAASAAAPLSTAPPSTLSKGEVSKSGTLFLPLPHPPSEWCANCLGARMTPVTAIRPAGLIHRKRKTAEPEKTTTLASPSQKMHCLTSDVDGDLGDEPVVSVDFV